ncbi:MAG: hypothetical protein P1U85_19025 [Verrucomicrobiales bacterium]|jgi:hypothetical protein|nr:hypothetical protein [Verrucomicrobiales bacterium]
MKSNSTIRFFYLIAALYDGVLGLAFLFAPTQVFAWLELEAPNHLGYIHFPAALLLVFAILFFSIARNPVANRNLIPFGILLKISYCGVVLFHWVSSGVPSIWKPFFFADLIFIVLFVWTWRVLSSQSTKAEAAAA